MTVSVPPEIAWIVPIAIPLVVGLLVGAIVKRTIKLVLAVVALIIILVATGLISITFGDIFDRAMEMLPKIISTGEGAIDALPYSSSTFLIGLAIGLWKG